MEIAVSSPDWPTRTRLHKLLFGWLRSAAQLTSTSRASTNRDQPTDASRQTSLPRTRWEFLAWALDDHDRAQRLHSLITTIGASVARIGFAIAFIGFAAADIVYVIQLQPKMWAYVLTAMSTVITIALAIRKKKYRSWPAIMGDRKNRASNPDE